MSDLSPEARAIVDAARPAGHGTDEDRERVRAALRVRLLAAAAVASSETASVSSAPSASSASSIAGGSSGRYLAVLVLAVVIGGALFWRSQGQHARVEDTAHLDDSIPRPSTRSFTTPALPSSPAAIEPALPTSAVVPNAPIIAPVAVAVAVEPGPARRERVNPALRGTAGAHAAPSPTLEVPAAPVSPIEPTPPAAPLPSEPASHSTLADETRRLDEARTALRTNPNYALELLDEWNAIRPNGELREERRAQRVAALCALGRVDGARLEADRLLEEAPRSPQAGRVRASCAFAGR